jgi:hypothetical protein
MISAVKTIYKDLSDGSLIVLNQNAVYESLKSKNKPAQVVEHYFDRLDKVMDLLKSGPLNIVQVFNKTGIDMKYARQLLNHAATDGLVTKTRACQKAVLFHHNESPENEQIRKKNQRIRRGSDSTSRRDQRPW